MAGFAIEDLTFSYPDAARPALDHISLRIEDGAFLLVVGRSGCGKTTLLRHLKTVLAPHGEREGRVLLDGVELADIPLRDQAKRIGFVLQDPDAQIVTDKVWHELAFGLESLGCDLVEMRARVAEIACYFGIDGWMSRDVQDLSGGQKQLLNLASVMAMAPDVLVLDEPTAQLDPIAASEFLATVQRINRSFGVTIVMVEQRIEEVFAMADTVAIMDGGRVAMCGDPGDVAWRIFDEGGDMEIMMPSVQRICHGVEREAGRPNPDECIPLTVRDARVWLKERLGDAAAQGLALPYGEAPSGTHVLDFDGVWFRYGRELPDVLEGVDFAVSRGCVQALVGGNGVGKSTMLKIASGIVRPFRGKVRVCGRAVSDWKGGALFHGNLACLPQSPIDLFAKDTVEEDLAEMLPGVASEEASRRIHEMTARFGIEHLLQSHPADLSGGELQRAALSKVLLTGPELLLLDEPTKGLDAMAKRSLSQFLREFCGEEKTVLVVSHDVEFVARTADNVSMLFDGRIVSSGTPRRFFSSNFFYTTAASRVSRGFFENAITSDEVIELCREALG